MTAREHQLQCITQARAAKADGSQHYVRMFIGYARLWSAHVVREARARRLADEQRVLDVFYGREPPP